MKLVFDMFRHKTGKDYQYIEEYSKKIFEEFKGHVILNRGDRLTKDVKELDKIFNANVFLAEEARANGYSSVVNIDL
jgi:ClpP class serine protease